MSGFDAGFSHTPNAEVYDPATGVWTPTGTMSAGSEFLTATLLPDGRVLITAGMGNTGYLARAEIYDRNLGFDPAWQPVIDTASNPLFTGSALELTGTGFRGISQASGGGTNDSATNYPLVQLRRIDSEQTQWLLPDPLNPFSEAEFISGAISGFTPGYAMVTAFVNGIPGDSKIILVGTPRTLQINKSGSGSGSVSSDPAGITCGSACSARFAEGISIILTATPAAGSSFGGWSGSGCSGTETCTVVMGTAQTVTAGFVLITSTTTTSIAPTTTSTAASTTTTAASTTTTSIKKKCPLIKAAGSEQSGILTIFRTFRDSRLAKTETGRALINLYYSHSEEVSQMLAASDGLNNRVRSLMFRLAPPLFMSLYRGMSLSLTGPQYSQIIDLVMEIKNTASPGLRSALEVLLGRLADGSLQHELGFRVR